MSAGRVHLGLRRVNYLPFRAGLTGNLCRSPPAQRRMSTIATVTSLDHLVLTVKDLNASVSFYEKFLGMKHTSFTSGGVERHALAFGSQKINLHISGKEFEPKAERVQPGSADLCFLVQDRVDEVLERLKSEQVNILEDAKVVDRTGARGKLRSVYIRDPDGNLIEYVQQEPPLQSRSH